MVAGLLKMTDSQEPVKIERGCCSVGEPGCLALPELLEQPRLLSGRWHMALEMAGAIHLPTRALGAWHLGILADP